METGSDWRDKPGASHRAEYEPQFSLQPHFILCFYFFLVSHCSFLCFVYDKSAQWYHIEVSIMLFALDLFVCLLDIFILVLSAQIWQRLQFTCFKFCCSSKYMSDSAGCLLMFCFCNESIKRHFYDHALSRKTEAGTLFFAVSGRQ